MAVRMLAMLALIAALAAPAAAQDRVTVGTVRQPSNGALFLADAAGYFTAEGLDVDMKAYSTPAAVAEAMASGTIDFGLTDFSATTFGLAGAGVVRAVAGQAREKRDVEGNDIVVSLGAYGAGIRKPENLRGRSVGITSLGSIFHYQIAEIARAKNFDFASIKIRPMLTNEAVAQAVADGQIDAAILPVGYARNLMMSGLGRLMAWCSDFGEEQLGALFVASNMIERRRPIVAKFVHAYRRGAADYAAALVRYDRFRKPVSDSKSRAAAATIARYVYPGQPSQGAIAAVELGAHYIDPQARLDAADIERQIAWFKSQKLIEDSVNPRKVIDQSFADDQ